MGAGRSAHVVGGDGISVTVELRVALDEALLAVIVYVWGLPLQANGTESAPAGPL
jgi:hypothetical protein